MLEPAHTKHVSKTPRVDLLERLLCLFSEEQAALLLTAMEAECDISNIRQSRTRVEILFRNGHPDYVNRTDGQSLHRLKE